MTGASQANGLGSAKAPESSGLGPTGAIPSAIEAAIAEVRDEIARAIAKFPTWPTDPLHAVAVFGEEAGELTKATLQAVYEPGKNKPNAVRDEARQAAAMAVRFLASIREYEFKEGLQHVVR